MWFILGSNAAATGREDATVAAAPKTSGSRQPLTSREHSKPASWEMLGVPVRLEGGIDLGVDDEYAGRAVPNPGT